MAFVYLGAGDADGVGAFCHNGFPGLLLFVGMAEASGYQSMRWTCARCATGWWWGVTPDRSQGEESRLFSLRFRIAFSE